MSKDQNLDIERKQDHIEINLTKNVESTLTSGFESMQFIHNALPGINYDSIDTTSTFLGKSLQAPILISSMTGGTTRAGDINYRLAQAAQKAGIAMGIGSMRVLLTKPDTIKTFAVRDVAPDIPLLANIGAVQLNYGVTPKECQYLVNAIKADALILHLNVLQELTQPEGNRNWENLLPKIRKVVNYLSVPVIVKEVGYGLSKQVAENLIEAGVKILDIAGSGGTSWSQVEAYRTTNSLQNRIASSFINWGIPTLDSLKMVREVSGNIPIIASGGLKSGIDGAKAIRMGANIFGLAGQLLKAADISESLLSEEIQLIIEQLKITMLCTGSRTLKDLTEAEIKLW
ncbi:type 2 isopentenyl-diphosphate Delta-isomerase [Rickettsia asembonensis]|uniref:Isopentenyl-diphosphate delta-isomerase n=1 Tax=Rickettsia asembonensis TaxID=1068590 RepID=A0A0C2LZA5_9RICK|nr:type 2 isopentenyl-diphosphate Delta-isomerase [Rickettsia asembonensis]KIJ88732.1 isopentenyl pyrophosphate isomerase [Rickettsia asembonensis]